MLDHQRPQQAGPVLGNAGAAVLADVAKILFAAFGVGTGDHLAVVADPFGQIDVVQPFAAFFPA